MPDHIVALPDMETLELLITTLWVIGAVVSAILTAAVGVAWKMAKGLTERDALLSKVVDDLAAHQQDCDEKGMKRDEFETWTRRRLEEGSKLFRKVARSLGRIEGRLGLQPESDDD